MGRARTLPASAGSRNADWFLKSGVRALFICCLGLAGVLSGSAWAQEFDPSRVVTEHPADNPEAYRRILPVMVRQGAPDADRAADDSVLKPYSPLLPGLSFDDAPETVVPGYVSWNDDSEQYIIPPDDDTPLGWIRDPFESPSDLIGSDFFPVRDRYRLGFPYWDRFEYNNLPFQERIRYGVPASAPQRVFGYSLFGLDFAYNTNWLKGDVPIRSGGDVFLETTFLSESFIQVRRKPVNVTGDDEDVQRRQRFFLTTDLFKDDNSFTLSPWFIRVTQGLEYRDQTDQGVSLDDHAFQELFLDLQLGVVSEYYDTMDLRIGRQLFVSDFRGFLYSDFNDMVRWFGTWDENLWQWNVVVMNATQQDAVSQFLRTHERREQTMVAADVFRRDYPVLGFNLYGGLFYTHDYFKQTVDAFFVQLAAEGVVGEYEISAAFIQALGHDSANPIAGRAVDVNAQFAALEITRPTDWYVPRFSVLYASGDGNPTDGTGRGFDAIFDNPDFGGANFAYLNREQMNARGLRLSNFNSFLPNLRTKAFDPSNFVNPGILVLTAGIDTVLTTRATAFFNYNWYRFNEPAALEEGVRLRNGGLNLDVRHFIGADYTIGVVYKPVIIDNLVFTFGTTLFVPGTGLTDLTTETSELYTTFGAATIVY
jgi:hypothetical protein